MSFTNNNNNNTLCYLFDNNTTFNSINNNLDHNVDVNRTAVGFGTTSTHTSSDHYRSPNILDHQDTQHQQTIQMMIDSTNQIDMFVVDNDDGDNDNNNSRSSTNDTNIIGNDNIELVPIAAELTDLFESHYISGTTNKRTQHDEQPPQEDEESLSFLSSELFESSLLNNSTTNQTSQNYIDILRQNVCNNTDSAAAAAASRQEEQLQDHHADTFSSTSLFSSDAINNNHNNNSAMGSTMAYPQNSNDSWETRFQELQDFYREYGHTIVPHNYTPNKALAQWVKRQRSERKNKLQGQHSTLTDNREHALNSLNFTWDAHESSWEFRWNELLQFKSQNGHCNVPASFESNKKLATWVKCQRRHFRLWRRNDSGSSSMTVERFNRLNEIGFTWNPRNL